MRGALGRTAGRTAAALAAAALLVPAAAAPSRTGRSTGLVSHARAAGSEDAVLRVEASRCPGSPSARVGTAFLWQHRRQAVTALHVIAGCGAVTAYSEHDRVSLPVQVVRVHRRADLALLAVGAGASGAPLAEAVAAPAARQALYAYGYGEAVPRLRSFEMKVALGAPTLADNVPPDVHAALARAGTPALNVDVVPIDAAIAAGLSGAPLVDAAGRVRAVADGGVQHGITHVSWAIPVKYLAELAQSTESAAGVTGAASALSAAGGRQAAVLADVYAADFVAPNAAAVQCGSALLRQVRSVEFADVAASTDSPLGLQQLLATFGGAPSAFSLDVYSDAASGATVAVPAGAALRPRGDHCTAELADGRVGLYVQVTRMAPDDHPDMVANRFEQGAGSAPVAAWAVDPAWSMYMPFVRPDGLIVRRKAFGKMYPPNPYGVASEYLFETLAARNGTFVGVAATRRDDYRRTLCMRGMPNLGCPPASDFEAWKRAALAVHLTTFPVTASQQQGRGSWQQR